LFQKLQTPHSENFYVTNRWAGMLLATILITKVIMGFALTLLYIDLLFLTPTAIVPSLAPFRLQLILGLAALACSVPAMLNDRRWYSPQLLFFAALIIWIPASLILGPLHYLTGAIDAISNFLPAALVLVLVIVNCQSVRRLRILLFTLLLVAAAFVIKGAEAYRQQDASSPFVITQSVGADEQETIFRVRALGVLSDPNDFAQFMLVLVPFIWFGRERGKRMRKVLIALPLTAFFVWGAYLTHSRGAIVGTAVVLLFAFRKSLGNTRAAILTGCLVLALFAFNFSGGRQVSMEGGSDRLDLWGDGIDAFKTSPLFGIGFDEFADAAGSGHTAHNSFVLCLAELGTIGYFFWLTPVVITLFQLHDIADSGVGAPDPTPAGDDSRMLEPDGSDATNSKVFDLDAIKRFATISRLSLIGFLTTSWFLSRAYSATCWLTLGVAIASIQITRAADTSPKSRSLPFFLRWSVAAEIVSIAVVYVMIRISNIGG
jgi:O-antigen ligase